MACRLACWLLHPIPDGTSPPDSTVLSIAGPDAFVIELAREPLYVHWKDAVG